jgi:dynein heavy chain
MSIIRGSLSEYLSLFKIQPLNVADADVYLKKMTCEQKSPRFSIRLEINKETASVVFDPPLDDLRTVLIDSIRFITSTFEGIPLIESAVFETSAEAAVSISMNEQKHNEPKDHNEVGVAFLQVLSEARSTSVTIDAMEANTAHQYIHEYTTKCFGHAENYVSQYDVFCNLFRPEIEKSIDEFLRGDHSFEETIEEINQLKAMLKDLSSLPQEKEMVMLYITSKELHSSIQTRVQFLISKFVDNITERNLATQNSICKRYQMIQERATKVPDNFKELSEQMEYMQNCAEKELPELLDLLDVARSEMMTILNLTILSPESLELNTYTFTWPARIEPALGRYEEIFLSSKEKAEKVLIERRIKFENELVDLENQIDELKDVGDLDDLPFYVKKIQALSKQLQIAQETVSSFNKEEQLYGLEISTYPQRKKLSATLEPFQNLYNAATNFQKGHKRWMEGNLAEQDVEQIEVDIDSIQREMHKCMGKMTEFPAAVRISTSVKEKLQEFVLNLPLMRVLCNPGMRMRHWEKISQIVGTEIRPDGNNLSRMLKMSLEKHLTEFQEVSGICV